MKISQLYNNKFDDISVELASYDVFLAVKENDIIEAGLPEEDFVCLEDIKKYFSISRHEAIQILESAKIKSVAVRRNVVEGKKAVGIATRVFRKEEIENIKIFLYEKIPVDKLKSLAREIIERDDNK